MAISGKMFVCEPCRDFVIVINVSPQFVPPYPTGDLWRQREMLDDRVHPEYLQAPWAQRQKSDPVEF